MDKFPQGGTGAWTGGPARRRALQALPSDGGDGPVRAIVVADEESSALFLARVLARAGCRPRRAGRDDAVAAVSLGEADLLIVEWATGEGEALELVAAARSEDADVAIVLVAAEESPAMRQLASSVGADEVLLAPVSPRVLTERVRLLSVRTARERRLARIRLARSPAAVPPAAGHPHGRSRAEPAEGTTTDPVSRLEDELERCYEAWNGFISCWASPGRLVAGLASSTGRVVSETSAGCGERVRR